MVLALNDIDRALSNGAGRRVVRSAAVLLPASCITAGLVPPIVWFSLLFDGGQGNGYRGFESDLPMLIVATSFAAYVTTRLLAERSVEKLRRLVDRNPLTSSHNVQATCVWTAHSLVVLALLTIIVVPFDYVRNYHVSDVTYYRTGLMVAIGSSLFVIALLAWRSNRLWRSISTIAFALGLSKAGRSAAWIVRVKPVYETIWLCNCWLPFAMVVPPDGPLKPYYSAVAGIGQLVILGYGALVWIPMFLAISTLSAGLIARSER
jgi:hypothetical protein